MNDFKVLFVGQDDWANLSHRIANAINWVTARTVARVYTENAHPFGYRQDIVGDREELARVVSQMSPFVDWVIYGGDGGEKGYDWFDTFMREHKLQDQPRAVRHAGSEFRATPAAHRAHDKALKMRATFVMPDLYSHVAHMPEGVPFVPATNIALGREQPRRVEAGVGGSMSLDVAHIPSNADTKGTEAIRRGLAEVTMRARLHPGAIVTTITEPGTLSYQEAAEVRRTCHVYVDQIAPEIGGFGASAVEAMAMGAVAMADTRNVSTKVGRFFPLPPITHVPDEHRLQEAVWQLATQPELLADRRRGSWKWARDVAGYAFQGRYFLQHLWARSRS